MNVQALRTKLLRTKKIKHLFSFDAKTLKRQCITQCLPSKFLVFLTSAIGIIEIGKAPFKIIPRVRIK